ncbi:MAG TPA: NAD(P)-binding domain-containing protein, partial [Candidatus Paceibacterota bacterium]|nr:NAD(P)-binding domain-containing protein [Candidatus Paceibacterota bacterium]
MTRNTKSVAVVGLGYVGLPLALLADRKGYKTYGIDIDANKIEKLSKRIAPYKDI